MATLRESLQNEAAVLKNDLAAVEAKIATAESNFSIVLDKDVEDVKAFFTSVKVHLGL